MFHASPNIINFRDFSELNRFRCESSHGFGHSLSSWSLSDWMVATQGELGEAANIIKKLNRCRDNIPGNKETSEELKVALKKELADVFCYLDLMAQAAGIDLGRAIIDKFNEVNQRLVK